MPDHESFRALKVWQQSMTLVEEIYRVTRSFRSYEGFGLTSQIRRASVSIPSNIGEGKRRKRQPVFVHHLDIALGSQAEVEGNSKLRSVLDLSLRMTMTGFKQSLRKSAAC